MDYPNEEKVQNLLTSIAFSYAGMTVDDVVEINSQDFQTIKIQFMAHKLISTSYSKTTKGGMALFWSLTELGQQLMFQWRTIKTTKTNNNTFKK